MAVESGSAMAEDTTQGAGFEPHTGASREDSANGNSAIFNVSNDAEDQFVF